MELNNYYKHSKNPPFKWGIFYFISFVMLLSHYNSTAQSKLKFSDSKKNFGFVKQGTIVDVVYEFTNAGNAPLVITEAKVECSCTSVEFPKQPIAPGQKNKILIKFDTKTVYDRQDRIVEIYSNDNNSPAYLRFKGVVLKK